MQSIQRVPTWLYLCYSLNATQGPRETSRSSIVSLSPSLDQPLFKEPLKHARDICLPTY